jgi:hypothetical protein
MACWPSLLCGTNFLEFPYVCKCGCGQGAEGWVHTVTLIQQDLMSNVITASLSLLWHARGVPLS